MAEDGGGGGGGGVGATMSMLSIGGLHFPAVWVGGSP